MAQLVRQDLQERLVQLVQRVPVLQDLQVPLGLKADLLDQRVQRVLREQRVLKADLLDRRVQRVLREQRVLLVQQEIQ